MSDEASLFDGWPDANFGIVKTLRRIVIMAVWRACLSLYQKFYFNQIQANLSPSA
jgi:hypothetical protein